MYMCLYVSVYMRVYIYIHIYIFGYIGDIWGFGAHRSHVGLGILGAPLKGSIGFL